GPPPVSRGTRRHGRGARPRPGVRIAAARPRVLGHPGLRRVREIIRSRAGLDRWREAGDDALVEREAVYQGLAARPEDRSSPSSAASSPAAPAIRLPSPPVSPPRRPTAV